MVTVTHARAWSIPSVKLETLKWVALITMTFGHLNSTVLAGAYPVLNEIGRISMPLYAVALAYSLASPASLHRNAYGRCIVRLLLFGVVAMPAYWYLWQYPVMNILFTYAAAVGVIWLIELRRYWVGYLLFAASGFVVDFQWPGIMLCVSLWLFFRSPGIGRAVLVLVAFASLELINRNLYAFAALPVIAITLALPALPIPRIRWLFPVYYVGHLVILAIAVGV